VNLFERESLFTANNGGRVGFSLGRAVYQINMPFDGSGHEDAPAAIYAA
jgi:hypothetical protein